MSEQINIEFFDEYKRLDKLCTELFGKNSGGITSYINEMEAKSIMGNQTRRIAEWNGTLAKLKKLRHIRNNMAHGEISFGDVNCTQEDVEWLRNFYDRIMQVSDPLAQYRKNREAERMSWNLQSNLNDNTGNAWTVPVVNVEEKRGTEDSWAGVLAGIAIGLVIVAIIVGILFFLVLPNII